MKKTLLNAIVCIALVICASFATAETAVKYVFLFIGDGMSIPQRMMAEEYLQRHDGGKLLINEFPHQALTATRSSNSFITDSAASGTAIACGEKTKNGRIGMDAAGTNRFESVAYVARNNGRRVGIVTSVTLNHATPAAFYAFNPSRARYYQIGLDLVESEFDYFGGGGIMKSNDQKDEMYKGNIYDLAQEKGYVVSRSPASFSKVKPGDKAISVGGPGALPYDIDREEGDLTLADFTRQAIETLDNPNGFFIMVEGGKIDWVCHANDAATTIHEVIDFDKAVRVAHEFAQKHPEDTLIVVTGDHETGGLTLGFAGTGSRSYIENLSAQTASRPEMVEALKQVEGIDFETFKPVINKLAGFIFDQHADHEHGTLILTSKEQKELEDTFAKHIKEEKFTGHSQLTTVIIKTLNNKSGIAWTSGSHTGLPVSTTAYGAQGDKITTIKDNTDIAKLLKTLVR